eukprot:1160445-Pelagomonas_calceolata.AAC.11
MGACWRHEQPSEASWGAVCADGWGVPIHLYMHAHSQLMSLWTVLLIQLRSVCVQTQAACSSASTPMTMTVTSWSCFWVGVRHKVELQSRIDHAAFSFMPHPTLHALSSEWNLLRHSLLSHMNEALKRAVT